MQQQHLQYILVLFHIYELSSILNPIDMIASVDTDKHVCSPKSYSCRYSHSLFHTSDAPFSLACGKVMVYDLGSFSAWFEPWSFSTDLGLRGFLRAQTHSRTTRALSLQPVLRYSVSKAARRGNKSESQMFMSTGLSSPVLCSLTHSSLSLVGSTLRSSLSTGSMVLRSNSRLSLLMIYIKPYCINECEWGCLTHALVEHVSLVS